MDDYSLKAGLYLQSKIIEAEAASTSEQAALEENARHAFAVLEQATGAEVRPALKAWHAAIDAHLASISH